MKRGVSWSLLCIFVFSIIIPHAYSIGLVYPRSYLGLAIQYEPGSEYTLSYNVRTNAGSTMDYSLWAEGEFAEYVSFDPPVLKDIPDGAMPSFSAIIKFPDSTDVAGPTPLRIFVGEGEVRGGGSMGVRTTSYHEVAIRVPYPDLYAELSLGAPNVNEGEPVHFLAKVNNMGEKDIQAAVVSLNIYNGAMEIVKGLQAGPVPVLSQESENLEMIWDTTGVKPGEYLVAAKLNFDGKTVQEETRFKIGTMDVRLLSYSQVAYVGAISRFDVSISSLWNNPMTNVYASLELPSFPVMESPTIQLSPFEESTLTTFIDAKKAEPGQVEGSIVLHFMGETKKVPILIVLEEPDDSSPLPDVIVQEEPGAIKSVLSAAGKFSNALMMLIIILILIEVFWIFKRKR